MVTADFDSDGRADVAASNADGTINVLYGEGDGGFAERTILTGGAATLRGIIAADLNGDAATDIASADPFSGKLLVFLNSGTGRGFDGAITVATWIGARNLLAEDVDGDGNLDLAVAGSPVGVKQFRGDGAGGFTEVGPIPGLESQALSPYEFKPVYTLRSFRPAGSALPKLAVTHADTTSLWVLGATTTGGLEIESELFSSRDNPNFRQLHDFEIAPVSSPLASSVPDLITVSKVSNTVTIWRGSSVAPYFFEEPFQQFSIAGGPRAVEVADTDHDGWGELAIVVRNFDRALVYRNVFGLLEPMATLPSPRSPRDLVMPDLNGDGCAELVVINRRSNDLKSHLTDQNSPDGFEVPRQLYASGADPAGLAIADLDGDGRGEVIQLHRAAGDVSVRRAQDDGSLADPVHYPMGVNPNSLTVTDLNDDGHADISVANLGRGSGGGNLGIRHGDGAGGFGDLLTITPPTNSDPGAISGPLAPGVFALVQADVDGDGIEDQIVGYFDCRVTFFRGLGGGGYEAMVTTTFVYESRLMVAGDFDQDGDIDIAGAGAAGEGVVLVNNGDFFTNASPERFSFYVGDGGRGNARSAIVRDLNDDGARTL